MKCNKNPKVFLKAFQLKSINIRNCPPSPEQSQNEKILIYLNFAIYLVPLRVRLGSYEPMLTLCFPLQGKRQNKQ